MSASNERPESQTPFEMVQDCVEGEHPIDKLVALRLPQTELRTEIRNAIDDVREALGDRESLWYRVESLLSDRNSERHEAYFNVGYEYGRTAGRAEAFNTLGDNRDLQTRELAERLRALAKESDLSPRAVLAALLENAWIFAFDIPTADES